MASERAGKDGVIRLMPCVIALPCRPSIWRKHAWVVVKQRGSIKAAAEALDLPDLKERLNATNDDFSPEAIRRCVRLNPTFTIEELAPHLDLTPDQLREIVHGKSD